MRRKNMLRSLVLGGLWCLLPAAFADTTGVWTVQGGQQIKVEYRSPQAIRVELDNGASLLIKDGKTYLMQQLQGSWRVMDLDSVRQQVGQFRQMLGGMNIHIPALENANQLPNPQVDMTATGKTEQVAGFKGEVYQVKVKQPDGQTMETDAVLTDAPEIAQLQDALVELAKTNAKSLPGIKIPIPDVIDKTKGKGLLRYGDMMRLQSVSKNAIPDQQFELPAKPTSLGLS